jgi:hypothetical protein
VEELPLTTAIVQAVVYDLRAECRDAARAEKFRVAERPEEWPRDVSVIVGVTGNDSVDPAYCLEAMTSHREPLVLVSGSSRRREFAGLMAALESMGAACTAYPVPTARLQSTAGSTAS